MKKLLCVFLCALLLFTATGSVLALDTDKITVTSEDGRKPVEIIPAVSPPSEVPEDSIIMVDVFTTKIADKTISAEDNMEVNKQAIILNSQNENFVLGLLKSRDSNANKVVFEGNNTKADFHVKGSFAYRTEIYAHDRDNKANCEWGYYDNYYCTLHSGCYIITSFIGWYSGCHGTHPTQQAK